MELRETVSGGRCASFLPPPNPKWLGGNCSLWNNWRGSESQWTLSQCVLQTEASGSAGSSSSDGGDRRGGHQVTLVSGENLLVLWKPPGGEPRGFTPADPWPLPPPPPSEVAELWVWRGFHSRLRPWTDICRGSDGWNATRWRWRLITWQDGGQVVFLALRESSLPLLPFSNHYSPVFCAPIKCGLICFSQSLVDWNIKHIFTIWSTRIYKISFKHQFLILCFRKILNKC